MEPLLTVASGRIGAIEGSGGEGPIRRRTLTLIRWIAITGQTIALFVADYWLSLSLPLGPLIALVAASALVNLLTPAMVGKGLWLTEAAAARLLAYDLLQLGGLLVLTGGLANPFSVLILAPVTVSAATLSARSTALLAALAVHPADLAGSMALALALVRWPTDPAPAVHRRHLGGAGADDGLYRGLRRFSGLRGQGRRRGPCGDPGGPGA